MLLIKRDTNSLDMLEDVGVGDVAEDGEVNGVGEEQIVKFIHDAGRALAGSGRPRRTESGQCLNRFW